MAPTSSCLHRQWQRLWAPLQSAVDCMRLPPDLLHHCRGLSNCSALIFHHTRLLHSRSRPGERVQDPQPYFVQAGGAAATFETGGSTTSSTSGSENCLGPQGAPGCIRRSGMLLAVAPSATALKTRSKACCTSCCSFFATTSARQLSLLRCCAYCCRCCGHQRRRIIGLPAAAAAAGVLAVKAIVHEAVSG